MSTATIIATTGNIVSEANAASHAISATLCDKLDPEWVQLWNGHGRYKMRADEVPVEQYREDPAAYSFTYPTWPGEYEANPFQIRPLRPQQGPMCIKFRTYRFQSITLKVKWPLACTLQQVQAHFLYTSTCTAVGVMVQWPSETTMN